MCLHFFSEFSLSLNIGHTCRDQLNNWKWAPNRLCRCLFTCKWWGISVLPRTNEQDWYDITCVKDDNITRLFQWYYAMISSIIKYSKPSLKDHRVFKITSILRPHISQIVFLVSFYISTCWWDHPIIKTSSLQVQCRSCYRGFTVI